MDILQNIQLDINNIFLQNIKIKNKLDKHNTIQKEIFNLAKKYNLTSELEFACQRGMSVLFSPLKGKSNPSIIYFLLFFIYL